ncbi:MAG: hemolysin family protein [Snowella sp.]|nr:hemolysin family protein [Snowella sp.]
MNDLVGRLFFVFLFIGINAFFVTAEFAIVTVRRSRINQLVDEGDLPARRVKSLQKRLDRLLATTQLGISLVSVGLGWISQKIVADVAQYLLTQFDVNPAYHFFLTNVIALPLAFFLIIYSQIVLGELCPKSLALLHAEQFSRSLGPIINAIATIAHPFIWLLDESTKALLKLGGVTIDRTSWYSRITPEELQLIIATEGESSGLDSSERTILNNMFKFGSVSATEIMVPRHQLSSISETITFSELLQKVAIDGHSRYPVTGESLDDILGIIDFKDLAIPLSTGQLNPETPIEPWVKPVRFVPESTPLSDLLTMMQRSHLKTVMVVDEFGRTSGLITLEDLVEEILGESSHDENDENEDVVVLERIDDETVIVEAQMNLTELNEILGLDLPFADDYQTLGGFLLYQWQKIPTQNESLTYGNLTFTVVTVQGPRLEKIRIHRGSIVNSPVTPEKTPTFKSNPILVNHYSHSR